MLFLVLTTDARGVHASRVIEAESGVIARLAALQTLGWSFDDTTAEPYDGPAIPKQRPDAPEALPERLYRVSWKDYRGTLHEWVQLFAHAGEAWCWAIRMGATSKSKITITAYGT